MLLVYDKPTIQYVVEEAVSSGIDDILIITGRGKRFIEDHFDKSAELKVTLENADKLDCLRQVMDIGGLADICYVGQKIKMAWVMPFHALKSILGMRLLQFFWAIRLQGVRFLALAN